MQLSSLEKIISELRTKRRAWWLGLALAMMVGAVFWRILDFDFVRWDDDISFTQNPLITEPWSLDLIMRLLGAETAMRFKPLHWIMGRAVYQVAGFEPAAWHFLGWSGHVLASLLAFGALNKLLQVMFPEADKLLRQGTAWAGALLWALHPLRVEPVAWATASAYSWAISFGLGACWMHWQAKADSRRGWMLRVGAWMLFSASCATYPVMITLPFALLVLDAYFLRPFPGGARFFLSREGWRWCVPYLAYGVSITAALIPTLYARFFTPGIFGAAPPLEALSASDRILAAFARAGGFFQKFVFATDLTPNMIAMRPMGEWNADALLCALIVAAGGVMVWLCRKSRRGRGAWVFLMGFGLLALPCLGLTETPSWPVDRYSYAIDLWLVGGLVCLVLAFPWFQRRVGRVALVAVALVVVGISTVATMRLLPIWRDTQSLFSHMEKHPDFMENPAQAAHVYKIWAYYHGARAEYAETAEKLGLAARVYREGMKRYLMEEDFPRAISLASHQEAAIGIDPVIRRERAYWLLQVGDLTQAREDLRLVLEALPDDERASALWVELETR